MCDSTGWVYDKDGMDVEAIKQIKEVRRGRISEYTTYRPNAEYHAGYRHLGRTLRHRPALRHAERA